VELEVEDPRWIEYISINADAGPFHHPSWALTLADSYGVRPFAVAFAGPGGRLEAGIPVAEVDFRLIARRFVALPFTDALEPLVSQNVVADDVAVEILRRAVAAGTEHVQIRASASPPFALESAGTRHVLRLAPDVEEVRRRFHPSQVRRAIDKAVKGPLVVRRGNREKDLTETFYGLHEGTRRRQGVPVQPRRFFRALWRRVIEPELGFVLLAYDGGTAVAGAVFLAWNRTVVYKFGASEPQALGLRPNHLVFWEAIRWACEAGYAEFDFGRTDPGHTSLQEFKRRWGTEERELVYAVAGRQPHQGTGRVERLAAPVIRHSPLWLCRLAGSTFYRYAA
jgi:CelD/BcsL family acetyltransferase involved in cellulose biosynthesis